MRTQEQIENLRKVFRNIYGPITYFWNDEDINIMADRIQEAAVAHAEWTWQIKVRSSSTKELEKDWGKIEKEPKTPHCSFRSIASALEKLFNKYPAISAIQISAKEDSDLVFEFIRS